MGPRPVLEPVTTCLRNLTSPPPQYDQCLCGTHRPEVTSNLGRHLRYLSRDPTWEKWSHKTAPASVPEPLLAREASSGQSATVGLPQPYLSDEQLLQCKLLFQRFGSFPLALKPEGTKTIHSLGSEVDDSEGRGQSARTRGEG